MQRAERVTLRRLEDDVPQWKVEFRAPREVAELFGAFVERVGLEAMLDHAISTWLQAERAFRDYADFERDGFAARCPAARHAGTYTATTSTSAPRVAPTFLSGDVKSGDVRVSAS
jgi:hypothetical protein